jgi:uncharacterized radical SAM superfamily Fe-S cluster-containing enzyme
LIAPPFEEEIPAMKKQFEEKVVASLCPICYERVKARIRHDSGAVIIEKACEVHGKYSDIYWSDVQLYQKFAGYLDWGGRAQSSPEIDCPRNCGLCNSHLSATLLGNIDITSRCNLSCPTCFAEAKDRIYEPSLDQIRAMMLTLRTKSQIPCPAVQFSGGEPTLRPDLPDIIRMAKDYGFLQIQIATNGVLLSQSLDLCRRIQQSGLHSVYLQFDGVTKDPHIAIRGRDLLQHKLLALQNFEAAGLDATVLVPTLIKGINDQQVGDIIRFAARNIRVVKGINAQPICFTGRIDERDRLKERLTVSDFLMLVEDQTNGDISRSDFYPVPFVDPIAQLIGIERGMPTASFCVHPHCGAATYVFFNEGRLLPITRFLDVEGLMEIITQEIECMEGSPLSRLMMRGRLLRELPRLIDEAAAPPDLQISRLLLKLLKSGTRESVSAIHKRALFIGSMHFQDLYNMDLERLRRCAVHYATPDGRLIPFCSYNTIYRRDVEERFSSPQEK